MAIDYAALRSLTAHRHADGRSVTVAPHAGDTFTIKTLKSMIQLQARWTEDDIRRIRLHD